ncbi:MAG: hypothetical protein HFE60_11225 [Anaerotignum sp.]|jgi:hypothetical protein|nr:hypothetical protein [Anaerotignum sp.]
MMESEEIKRSLSADEGGRLFYFAISIVIFPAELGAAVAAPLPERGFASQYLRAFNSTI